MGREHSSAGHIEDKVNETFEEQERQGLVLRTTYQEAKEIYRDRLRIAALGAVGPDGDERVVHDGTHQMGVNPDIRVRDQDETPLHKDLAAILGTEEASTPSGFFALAFDVSKAHRRVPPGPPDVLFGRGAGVHQGWRICVVEHGGHLRDRFGFLSLEPIRGSDGADPDRCGWSS